jgi:pentatricopeptide repeat protein
MARLLRSLGAARPARRGSPFARALCTSLAPKDPYAVLGLEPKASANDVKLAYYHLAIASSPSNSSAPDDEERFNAVGRAYSAISGEPFTWGASSAVPHASASGEAPLQQAPFVRAYPGWVHRLGEYLERVPQRLDLWLMPSWSSVIYHHLRAGELAQALHTLEEMKGEGEAPTHAVYVSCLFVCFIPQLMIPHTSGTQAIAGSQDWADKIPGAGSRECAPRGRDALWTGGKS